MVYRMKRGCGPAFKMLGSTPYKQDGIPDPDPPEIETPEPVEEGTAPDTPPEPVDEGSPPEAPPEVEESKDIEKTIEQKEEDEEKVKNELDEMTDEEKMRFIENYEREHLTPEPVDERTMRVGDPGMMNMTTSGNAPVMPKIGKVLKYGTQARQHKDEYIDQMKDGTKKEVLTSLTSPTLGLKPEWDEKISSAQDKLYKRLFKS